MKLYKIIKTKYYNYEEIIQLLKKYHLEQIINKSINAVESKLDKKEFQSIPNISGILLTNVNSLMGEISNPEDKTKIEYILSDLFQDYFNIISTQEDGKTILSEIQDNLKIACEIGGFDYNELSRFLDLEKSKILTPKLNQNFLHYNWNGEDYELDELSRDLYAMKVIFSVKEFKKLFKPISKNLIIKCNPEKKEFLLILFQVLKDRKIITPKGSSGHFAPIVKYCVDNEGYFLYKKAANKIHYQIKKNADKYNRIKELVVKLIANNINVSNG